MHDLLKGVCLYVMQSIIYNFVIELHYFRLEVLNTRIRNFDYGSVEDCNIPLISVKHVLKQKLHMKMSASEMLCLVRYFGLIIGDLIP